MKKHTTATETPENRAEGQTENPGNPTEVEANAEERAEVQAPPEGDAVPRGAFDKLKAERDELFDRLARSQAEFENARKRENRERAEFRDYAVAGAVEKFLPALDNFRLALQSSGSIDQLRTGVDLIVKQIEDVLRSLDVQPIKTVGVQFDPRVHEALETVERSDLPDSQVLDEVRRGYKIRDRLLRPALVRVVTNPGQKEA